MSNARANEQSDEFSQVLGFRRGSGAAERERYSPLGTLIEAGRWPDALDRLYEGRLELDRDDHLAAGLKGLLAALISGADIQRPAARLTLHALGIEPVLSPWQVLAVARDGARRLHLAGGDGYDAYRPLPERMAFRCGARLGLRNGFSLKRAHRGLWASAPTERCAGCLRSVSKMGSFLPARLGEDLRETDERPLFDGSALRADLNIFLRECLSREPASRDQFIAARARRPDIASFGVPGWDIATLRDYTDARWRVKVASDAARAVAAELGDKPVRRTLGEGEYRRRRQSLAPGAAGVRDEVAADERGWRWVVYEALTAGLSTIEQARAHYEKQVPSAGYGAYAG